MNALTDSFGRIHNYLRVSVTDRCNLHCSYCTGSSPVHRLARENLLSSKAIVRIIRVAGEMGVTRVRLTGGEPLLRPDLTSLIEAIHQIPGIADISLTTNGSFLAQNAEHLKQAGLNRINISVDSFNPQTYRRITGNGDLGQVLEGIDAALGAGLAPLKINAVFLQGLNDREFQAFFDVAYTRPLFIRFIEYMPIGVACHENHGRFRSLETLTEAAALIKAGILLPQGRSENGNAEIYAIAGGKGAIGFIRPLSQHFCGACNRLRLTADGFLKPCLYWPDELDLKPYLGRPAELKRLFFEAVTQKPEKHRMIPEKALCATRGMYGIGG